MTEEHDSGWVSLPVGVQSDIDEVFCYSTEETYKQRAHAYIERYEVQRGWSRSITAVQCVVEDIARRAFVAGLEGAAPRYVCSDCALFVPYEHSVDGEAYDGICASDKSPKTVQSGACDDLIKR